MSDLTPIGRNYKQDLELYVKTVFDLNQCVMSPKRRRILKSAKVLLESILSLYQVDYRWKELKA